MANPNSLAWITTRLKWRVSATLAPLSPAGDRYGVTVCARRREGKSDGAITLQRLANDSAAFVPALRLSAHDYM